MIATLARRGTRGSFRRRRIVVTAGRDEARQVLQETRRQASSQEPERRPRTHHEHDCDQQRDKHEPLPNDLPRAGRDEPFHVPRFF